MNGISFKDLDFFKKSSKQPKKNSNNGSQNNQEPKESPWKKITRSPFLYMLPAVIILSYSLSYLPSSSLPLPNIGEIADSDIVAPVDLTIEDKETTEKRQQEAVERILPVYSLDQNTFITTEERIREFFQLGRLLFQERATEKFITDFQKDVSGNYDFSIPPRDLNYLIRSKFSAGIEDSLINLVGKISKDGIIASKRLFIHEEETKGLILIKAPDDEKIIKVADLQDLSESKQALSREINDLDISQSEKSVLLILSHAFVRQNIRYDPLETQERQDRAISGVETVFYTIKQGKIIIRKGDEVSADILKEINIINQNLQAKPSWLTNFAGTFVLFALLLITSWYYLKSLHNTRRAFRYFKMQVLVLILSLLFYKLSLFLAGTFSESAGLSLFQTAESYYYAFPFQMGVLVFAFLASSPVALIYAVINSLVVGYLFNASFYLMVFSLVGGFAAIYGIKHYGKKKRSSPFQIGLFIIAPVNILVIITTHLIREKLGSVEVFAGEILMGVIGGLISAALAFLFLPVFESIFAFVTQSKLLELSNSDLTIFKDMALKAPGSYHHSLIVASVAEEAAKEIGLDPLLVKAGALYHDIGKIKRPEYFIENRTRNADMHRDLKPSMSTLVIINHVKNGVELAKKLKLPRKIREMIEQHHGNSLVRYFFEKAKEKYDPEMQKIGEESYRYPGPIPKSKEAALVMLADSIEAASRSLKKPSETNLKRLITTIFSVHMEDGQLDDCDFSLKELRAIASSFLTTMYTIYHPRVEYPGFDFEVKKPQRPKKNKISHDRNNKPPKQVLDPPK